MHQIIEEHYAHRIEVNIECTDSNAELSEIPFPVYTSIVDYLADNIRCGSFDGRDCYEYPDGETTVHYSGTWRILEPLISKTT